MLGKVGGLVLSHDTWWILKLYVQMTSCCCLPLNIVFCDSKQALTIVEDVLIFFVHILWKLLDHMLVY